MHLTPRRSRLAPGRHPRRGQRGVGLIELLVSIVIATLGLLALAGMQVLATRHARLTQVRAAATHLAQDLGERMRANNSTADSLAAYAYAHTFAEQVSSHAPDLASRPAPRCNAANDTCSALQMAAADLFEWRLDVRQLLPDGSVIVQPDAIGNAAGVDIWIAWRDPYIRSASADRGPSECPASLSVESASTVRCLQWRIRP